MIYENTQVYTIEKGCPWYDMQQYFGPPNVNWCEPTSCSIINEPSNAWTNLAYMLFALFLVRISKDSQSSAIRNFGWIVFLMGLFSFLYHSTNNLGSQFLDFVGMALYTGMMIAINFKRMNQSKGVLWPFISMQIINALAFPAFLYLNIPIQKIVVINIVVILLSEFFASKSNYILGVVVKYKSFVIALCFLAIAQTFSLLDHARVWCEPDNIFLHGHALWHIFGGISTYFTFMHYKQFDSMLLKDKA